MTEPESAGAATAAGGTARASPEAAREAPTTAEAMEETRRINGSFEVRPRSRSPDAR